MKVSYYNRKYKKKWDNFVNHSENGTAYHLIGWLDIMENTFKYKPFYIMVIDDFDNINGIMPLFLTRDILSRKYLISNPFSNFAGICSKDDDGEKLLLQKAKDLTLKKKLQYLEIRQQNKKFNGLINRDDFVTMHLNLENDTDKLWKKSLKAKTRNQVRKAQKSGLEIEYNSSIEDFYKVYSQNMRDLGTPPYPIKFIRKQMEFFPRYTEILSAKYQGKVIASMYIFKFKKVFSDPLASSLREYNYLCPNNFLYWHAIKKACEEGYKIFDMGRSTLNTGTYNFKKQWGAKPASLYYQYFLSKSNRVPVVNAINNKYQVAIKLWKKMPLRFSNILGPKIVKYLPEL